MRRALAAVAVLGLSVLGAAPARAAHGVHHNWWDFHGHSCLSQTCWVTWLAVSAYSMPSFGDCAGSAGAFTACSFSLSCETEGWASGAYDLDCGHEPRQTCPFEVRPKDDPEYSISVGIADCRLDVHTAVVVPAGSCQDFPVTVTARSAVDSLPMTYAVRLCVTGSGPSLTELPYAEPEPRVDVP